MSVEGGARVGVIDSLSAGYRYLGWRLYLLLIPILLDLLLWVTPHQSVAPLFEGMARLYNDPALAQNIPPDIVTMIQSSLTEIGQGSNLLAILVNGTLLHVPSLLVMGTPWPTVVSHNITSPGVAVGLALLFGLLGILIGVIYLDLLAQQLPIGAGAKPRTLGNLMGMMLRHWFKVVLFTIVTIIGLLAIYIPISIGATLVMLFSPALAILLLVFMSGLLFVIFFYLYFVPVGLILDNLGVRAAIVQSFRLVRVSFWSTVGFFLLTYLIEAGFGLLFERLVAYQPMGTLAAIIANAYLGTGMALALLIFYRTQLLRMTGELTLGGGV